MCWERGEQERPVLCLLGVHFTAGAPEAKQVKLRRVKLVKLVMPALPPGPQKKAGGAEEGGRVVVAEPSHFQQDGQRRHIQFIIQTGRLGGGLSADQLGHTCPCLAEKGMSQQKPTRNQSSRTA